MDQARNITQKDADDLRVRSAAPGYKFTDADCLIAMWDSDQDDDRVLATGTGLYGESMPERITRESSRIVGEIQAAAFRTLDHHLNTSRYALLDDPCGSRRLHAKLVEEACLLIASHLDAMPELMRLPPSWNIESTTYCGTTKALQRSQRKMTDASLD